MADAPKFTQKKHSVDPSFSGTSKSKGKYPAPVGSYGGYAEIAASMKGKSRAPFAEAAGFHDRGAPASSASTPPDRSTKPNLRQASLNNKQEINFHGQSSLQQESARNKHAINYSAQSHLQQRSASNKAAITGAVDPSKPWAGSRVTSSKPSPADAHVAASSPAPAPAPAGKPTSNLQGQQFAPGSMGEYRQKKAAKKADRQTNGLLGWKRGTRSVLHGAANKL